MQSKYYDLHTRAHFDKAACRLLFLVAFLPVVSLSKINVEAN